jgi:hypothetical protein
MSFYALSLSREQCLYTSSCPSTRSSVCLSILSSHVLAQSPLDGLLCDLILRTIVNICREFPYLFKLFKNIGALCKKI